MIIKRQLKMKLPPGQSAFLWGARKTGKSTYLKQRFPNSHFFDLLDSDIFIELTKRPATFREWVLALPKEKKRLPIIVDEVQKVPMLLNEIQKLIEDEKMQFILSGSSARKLKKGKGNLLGGRAFRYEMLPLTSREISEFDLLNTLNRGLIPDHYLNDYFKKLLKSYVIDYLNEEIREEGLIRNLPAFSRFLDAAGFSVGELVNYTNIARECGVDTKTAKEYFNILCDTLIGYLIEPFAKSRSRQIITKSPKFYVFDVGVANQLVGRHISQLKGSEAGRAFENFILMELVAYKSYQDLDFPIRFWRTKQGQEVDFILGQAEVAIEVKISNRVEKKELTSLSAFANEFPNVKSYVISLEARPRLIKDKNGNSISILPYKDFLDQLWSGKL